MIKAVSGLWVYYFCYFRGVFVHVDNLVGKNGLFFSEKVLEVIIFILASENQIYKTYLINDTKDQKGLKNKQHVLNKGNTKDQFPKN